MQAKNLFRKFIMGQPIPCERSFDEPDIVGAIDELDAETLYKVVKEAQDNHGSDESKYANLGGWGSDFEANIATGSLSDLAKLLEKLQSHPKYTPDLGVYVVSRLKLNWNVGVWGAESFLPKISTVGNFAIRNHHRVIGLSSVDGVVEPLEKDEFLSQLQVAWDKQSAKKTFDGFVVHHASTGITLSKQLPSAFNEQGQTVVCLTDGVAKALKRKFPFVLEAVTGSRTGHAYLRQFGSMLYVYGDGRLDDDLDCQFSNNVVGFYEDADETDNVVSMVPPKQWVEETFIRVREELQSYLPIDVVDLAESLDDPLAAAFIQKGREFAESFTNAMTHSMVPTFNPDPDSMARQPFMVHVFEKLGLANKVHLTADVISTNLGFLFGQDNPASAFRGRLEVLNQDLAANDLPVISDIQIYLNAVADDAPSTMSLGSLLTLSDADFSKAIEDVLTASGFDFELAETDCEYEQEAFCDAIEAHLVVTYAAILPMQSALQVAANLSQKGRASLISGRFPAYQAYADFEEDSGSGGWVWVGFEGTTFVDSQKPDTSDDDDYYDEDFGDDDDN